MPLMCRGTGAPPINGIADPVGYPAATGHQRRRAVGWAALWAKAKENRARSRSMAWRGKTFVIGAMLALAGGYNLYSDLSLQIRGRPAMATIAAHIEQCTVEYQRIGEDKRQEQWPCDLAQEFQRRAGMNKVALSRQFLAKIQFPLEDG